MIPLTPWVKRLLVANVAVYVVTMVLPALWFLGALVPRAVLVRPWTPFTYMFLHDPSGIAHLLFNMLVLFFFGPRIEDRLGGRDFMKLYVGGGLAGAAGSIALAPTAAVVGASAAVYAVVAAFAMFWPRERIYIWGVLPVEAWLLITITVVVSLWFGLSGAGGRTAHFAHLGGLAWGFVFLKWHAWRRGAARREFQRKVQDIPSAAMSDRIALARWESIDTTLLHELNRQEVETLLRKVHGLGVRTLTQDERAFLDRMATRH